MLVPHILSCKRPSHTAPLTEALCRKSDMKRQKNQSICEWADVEAKIPAPGSKLGIALKTIGKSPINGLRHSERNGTCGWYIWCGEELRETEDFFSPLHVEHIQEHLPQVQEYLNLPPGFRFLIDGSGYEDVWFEPELLNE